MQCPILNPQRTGRHLRALMESRGITVNELQNVLGLSCPQTIYHWLSGSSLPTVDHLYSLSRYFQVTIDELVLGDGEPEEKH